MESGKVSIIDIYGYDKQDGMLYVNPEEAKIVKLIFHKYVYEGKGLRTIAQELNDSGALLSKRISKWTTNNVSRIISNEKYVGDLIFKKTVTPNFLDHKPVKNEGIEEKIYHTDKHEPIIDRNTWNLAREAQTKRAEMTYNGEKYTNRYWCSGKLRCATCGSFVVSRNKYNKDGTVQRFWYCRQGYAFGKSKKGKSGIEYGCNSNLIGDRALVECVRYALKYLNILDDSFLDSLYEDIMASCEVNKIESIKPLEAKITKNVEKKNKLIDWCLDGKIDEEEMQQLTDQYHKEIARLKSQIAEVHTKNATIKNAKDNLSVTLDAMRQIINQEERSTELYAEIVEKVMLHQDHTIDIYFKYIPEPVSLKYATFGKHSTYRVECTPVSQKAS